MMKSLPDINIINNGLRVPIGLTPITTHYPLSASLYGKRGTWKFHFNIIRAAIFNKYNNDT